MEQGFGMMNGRKLNDFQKVFDDKIRGFLKIYL